MELLSGAEMVVRFLRDEGVKNIYGYPGGALLHIYDALFKEPEVTHILVRHEQAATHMADGYARASYKLGKGKGAAGGYGVRADASQGGGTASAAASFTVSVRGPERKSASSAVWRVKKPAMSP